MKSRKKQTLIFGMMAGIGMILIAIVLWQFLSEHQLKSYKNSEAGFSVDYPPDWSVAENSDGVAVIFKSPPENDYDFFRENVNIVVQELPASIQTIEKYTDQAIKQMKAVFEENLIILKSEPTFLSGQPAHLFEYLGKGPQSEFQMMHVWTIKGKKAYQINFTSLESKYNLYVDQVKKMIKSFRIQ